MDSDERDELRAALLRYMTEDHADWRDLHEADLARLCGVEPGALPFTWRWAAARDRMLEQSEDNNNEGGQ